MDRRLQEENEKKKEYLKSYQRAVKRERDILEEIKRLRYSKVKNSDKMNFYVYNTN